MKISTYRWVGSLGVSCLLFASQAHARPSVYHRDGTCSRCDVPSYVVEHVKSDGEIKAPKRPKKSIVIGDFAVSKEAKEIPVNREISRCYLQLISGTVSINTVVVRPEKTALPQTVRLKPGEFHIIELGSKRLVTGFRISDSGRGTYRVIVK